MRPRQPHQALLTNCLFALAIAWAAPSLAHHSYAAYDSTRTQTLQGAITDFQWSNPHTALKILVAPNGGGGPIEWLIESSSPAILTRFGWTRNSIKRGDRVSVTCNPRSDGSHSGRLHTLVLLDTGQILETKLSGSDRAGQ